MQRTPTCENCQKNYELRDFRPIGPRIPLMLPCGHTFCEGCIVKAVKTNLEINCFICKDPILLEPNGESGVKNLLPNIYLLGILLYNRRMALGSSERKPGGPVSTFNGIGNVLRRKKLDQVSFSDSVQSDGIADEEAQQHKEQAMCDECSVKYATCQCKNCDNKFCDACFLQVHKSSKMLNKHSPLPLEYPSEEELSCVTHGRNLEFFDKDINELLCAMCIISDRCKGHEIIPVSEMEEKASDELVVAASKVKDVLTWLSHSSKVLTSALPGEVMEANYLFSEIHEKFTACHTLLLKRQIELMNEASDCLVKHGGINHTLQEVSKQAKAVSTALKEYEMSKEDRRVMTLKSNKFLETFIEYASIPCIVQEQGCHNSATVRFEISDETITTLETFANIEGQEKGRYHLKSIDEISEEEKDQIKSSYSISSSEGRDEVKENEILNEQTPLDTSKISKFSIMSGYHELVYVTHIKDPSEFQVQRASDKDRLNVLMTALNKYCRHSNSSEDLVYKTEEGQLLCAQFLADNNWYRARVINITSNVCPDIIPTWQNGLCIEVLYIDYGNTEWLPLNRLRQIKNQFLEIPEMAVSCSLTDIVPPFKAVVWPERSIKAFTSITGNQPLLMNVRGRGSGKLYVDLRKPEGDEEAALDDDRPISVRDALVFLEVAVFFSPASQPNADVHRTSRHYIDPNPLEKDAFVDVTLTHVENPHRLFIQRLDSSILDEQKHLCKLYTGRNKKVWQIDWPYKDLVCAAKFSVDQSWYRAVVRKVHLDDSVDVEFVDYGNIENLKFDDVKKIPQMYLALPKQCWPIKLHNVDMLDGEDEWNTGAKLLLEDFLNKPFVAVVKDMDENGIASIELFDTSTNDDVNINHLLIRKGLVKGLGESAELAYNVEEKNIQTASQTDTDVPSNQMTTSENSVSPLLSPSKCNDKHKATASIRVDVVSQYLPAVLPRKNEFSATGVYVDDDGLIYMHTFGSDELLNGIMADLNNSKFKVHPKSTVELSIGQACVGKYSLDGWWYRVKILAIIDDLRVKVAFVDFGNSEETTVNNLFNEGKHMDVPAQCICVKLANITPNSEDGRWSKQAIAFLRQKLDGHNLFVEMQDVDNKNSPYEVEIKLQDKTDIGKKLLSLSHATQSTGEMDNNNGFVKILQAADDSELKEDVAKSQNESCEETSLDDLPNLQQVLPVLSPTVQTIHHSAYLWYTEQQLPKQGVLFDVQVTQVNQPDLVYIQRNPPNEDEELFADDSSDQTAANAYAEIDQLYAVSDLINSEEYFNKNSPALPELQIGMACVCKYSVDDLFYRARIESINKDNKTVDVVFVDYGNAETVDVNSIKPLSADLINLPMQASLVYIAGVKPLHNSASKESKNNWSSEAKKNFFVMVANKRMIAQMVGTCEGLPKIHLYDRCLMEDSETGETNDVLIGRVMAENKIAEFALDEMESKIAQCPT